MRHNCSLAKAITAETHYHYFYFSQKNNAVFTESDISKSEVLSPQLTVNHGKQ